MPLFHHFKRKRIKKITLHPQKKRIDYSLLLTVIILSLFGLLAIFNISSVAAFKDFGDKFHYIKDQSKWFLLGSIGMFFFAFIDYHRLYNLALPLLLLTLFFLILVFVPGLGIKALGAHRWVDFKIISFQPAELVKLTLTIYLAAWFSYKERERFLAFFILLLVVVGLVVIEPDLGTAVVIVGVALTLYFLSGHPISHFFVLLPVVLLGVVGLALISPYRFKRLTTFWDRDVDPLGAAYHIRQVMIALGSGGLFGLGLGKSRQKFEYLPEPITDSIFAIIGEELGFFGVFILLLVFLFIIYRGFKIAKNAPDGFGKLLAAGISSWLAIQIVINLSSITAILPLTGLPLPFISYGGSNLIVTFLGIGILLNISRQTLSPKT